MHSEQICDNCKSKYTPLEPIYIIPDNEDSLEEIMDREEEGQLYLCEPCMADLRGEGNIAAVMQDRFKELSRRP